MTGAYYTEIVCGMPFSYKCTCLEFDQANKKVYIERTIGNNNKRDWVSYDDVTFYIY